MSLQKTKSIAPNTQPDEFSSPNMHMKIEKIEESSNPSKSYFE